jgi:predicted PurR-regulated permease PerM
MAIDPRPEEASAGFQHDGGEKAPKLWSSSAWRNRTGGLAAFAIILALLYLGRSVLVPFAVAVLLSLLVAPLVRALRRVGLPHAASVVVAVVALAIACSAAAAVVGSQILRIAGSLPQYENTIQRKLRSLNDVAVGRLATLAREAERLVESGRSSGLGSSPPSDADLPTRAGSPVAVEVHQPQASPFEILVRVLSSIWPPLEAAGIVLVVLVFVLLEQESLRDRFIRMAGTTHIRLTTLGLDDAAKRLSRFAVSQFAVNLGAGVAIAAGLALLGVPSAALWGALATLLRFVPYVGIWLAALLVTGLAMAVDPGWALAGGTLALFVGVELVVSQAVEPQLYGHTTGLSPLSVVVAAIFWSALWGPIGLILSTPLTLCLLVLGRHIPALNLLELVLGDTQALTLPQRFYQRVLSGDSAEIIALARTFLKRSSFAAYCDVVLLPALHLAAVDFEIGAISREQQQRMRDVVVTVVSALAADGRTSRRPRRRGSVLDDPDPGLVLRRQREDVTGKWQGPLEVPPGSVILCVGLGPPDGLAAELLVRVLRAEKLDARHATTKELDEGPPPGADPGGVGTVCFVSAFPGPARGRYEPLAQHVREGLPAALLAAVFLPGLSVRPSASSLFEPIDALLTSFVQTLLFCSERHSARARATEALASAPQDRRSQKPDRGP